jgi:hypothetical protein
MALMPIYCALTLAVLFAMKRPARDAAAVAAGFAIPLIVFAMWLLQHPDVFRTTAERYGFAGQAVRGAPMDLVAIADRYWRFFHPDFLFLTGDSYLPFSTRTAGVFPLAACAADRARRRCRDRPGALADHAAAGGRISRRPVAGGVARRSRRDPPRHGHVAVRSLLAGLGAGQLARLSRVPLLKTGASLAGVAAALAGIGYLAVDLFRTGPRVAHGIESRGRIDRADRHGRACRSHASRHGRPDRCRRRDRDAVRCVPGRVSRRVPAAFGGVVERQPSRRHAPLIEEHDKRPGSKIYFATFRNGQGDWDLKNRYLPPYWQFYVGEAAAAGLGGGHRVHGTERGYPDYSTRQRRAGQH